MNLSELAQRLAEAHRPVDRPYVGARLAGSTLRSVHCAACDGNHWTIWAPGDPVVECDLWREAVALGVVDP